MAEGVYQKWLEKENLLLMRGWKMKGLTDEQIAKKVGVTARTFEVWKKKYPQIKQAVKIGKEISNYRIENALFEKAMSGNVTAMIFWLKCNYKEKYNENMDSEELKNAQLIKVKAEARLAEARAELLQNGEQGEIENKIDNMIAVIKGAVGND